MERTHEQHPSYVQVSFSRTESSTGEVFYGSNIKANSYVTLRIEQSEKVNEGYRVPSKKAPCFSYGDELLEEIFYL